VIYGSVCSGIEAATVAWHPLGWKPAFFSEIEKFPREVLKHHYPNVPLHDDFTTIKKGDYEPIELLVGGTPCQSFSVAGLRAGLNDPRGNLMLEFGALAHRLQPKWLVWENVPGVLSSNGGRDFGSFLAMLEELGYGFSYRVLDAQYYGVPQRRRRVFVIGHIGSWQRAAAVLFEQHSLQGHPAPSREKRQEVTEIAGTLAANGGGLNRPAGNANELDFCVATSNQVANCLTTKSNMRNNGTDEDFVTYALAGNTIGRQPENGGNGNGYDESGVSYTLTKTDVHAVAHAFKVRGGCDGGGKGYLGQDEQAFTLSTGADQQLFHKMQVRRLMPIECERLQGFPDNYTNIPGATDSARYKALGNSMAVPVMRWIGERINLIEELSKSI
jgi:DNA (cytosine-5)-methyltransferase 1